MSTQMQASVARAMLRRLVATLFVGGAVLSSASCIADLEPDVGALTAGQCDPSDSDEEASVSFSQQVLPLFKRAPTGMSGCSCHSPGQFGATLAGLDLTSHAAVMRGGNIGRGNTIIPNDPCASVLIQKISPAPPFGARMPLNGFYLTEPEQQLIRDWVAEGALDN